MVGNTTRLLDLEDPKKNRDFAFDYSFWSHDEFIVNEAGYFEYLTSYSGPRARNTQTRNRSSSRSVSRFWIMRGRGIIAVCLPMARRERASPIPWSGMEPIRALCQSAARRSSGVYITTRRRIRSTRSVSPCWRSTMRRYRTCSSPSINEPNKASKSDNTRHWVCMSKGFRRISWIVTRRSRPRWTREVGIGRWLRRR